MTDNHTRLVDIIQRAHRGWTDNHWKFALKGVRASNQVLEFFIRKDRFDLYMNLGQIRIFPVFLPTPHFIFPELAKQPAQLSPKPKTDLPAYALSPQSKYDRILVDDKD